MKQFQDELDSRIEYDRVMWCVSKQYRDDDDDGEEREEFENNEWWRYGYELLFQSFRWYSIGQNKFILFIHSFN